MSLIPDTVFPALEERDETKLSRIIVLYLQHAPVASRTAKNNALSLLKIIERARGEPVKPETVTLSALTSALIVDYQTAQVKLTCSKASPDDTSQREAKERALRSSRSTVCQARCLFSKKGELDMVRIYSQNGITLPASLDGFMQEKLRGKISKRNYNTPADSVIDQTFSSIDLMRADRDVFLGFWLSAGAGLRRKEIRHCRWEHLIEVDGHGRVVGGIGKDGEMIDVPIQTVAWQSIAPLRKETGWVVEQRSDRWCKRLGRWMRGLGWNTRLKMHELRAYSGSLIYAKNPVAAMRWLRHKNIATTEGNYVRYKVAAQLVDVL